MNTINAVGPFLETILPAPPVPGQKFYLRQFPSTVQVIHVISEFREVVVAEFAIPYSPQSGAWWRQRIAEECQDYLMKYRRAS